MSSTAIVPASGLPVGTTLVYNATIDPSAFSDSFSLNPVNDLIAAIKSDLETTWDLSIDSSNIQGGVVSFGNPQLQLTLRLLGPETYGLPTDIQSIVDGEIINQTGGKNYILSSNISSFTLPSGTAQSTGAAAATPNQSIIGGVLNNTVGAVAQSVGSAVGNLAGSSGLGSALSSLQSSVVLIIVVVIVGLILLVAYKPQSVRTAAGAFL